VSRRGRAIGWEALDASSLDPQAKRVVGETWRERMRQEHLAVGAFSVLAWELAAEGADTEVLSLVTRAAADEVRHADLCRRMAARFLGDDAVPARFRGVPRLPRHAGKDRATRVLLHVVEMCCVSETITGVYFTEMVKRATFAPARAVVESLLEDEIDHGRAGWAYLAARASAKATWGLPEALPDILARVVGPTLDRAALRKEPDDEAKEAFGYLGLDTGARVVRRALKDVILPGFDLLGVDTAPARATSRERGWLRS
jgi:hypothetical protein